MLDRPTVDNVYEYIHQTDIIVCEILQNEKR